ncbi:MAG: histidinol dehydrogenase [Tepidanaerobacteraceae bacterium]|nr:histidinol dehydrogenase [Tepidanaerobacteraceae bacterium]HQE06031.1 histidinol dehydrogenase [Tepidanaerobacteraceae bacterium]
MKIIKDAKKGKMQEVDVRQKVFNILEDVRKNGDQALIEYNKKFDDYTGNMRITADDIKRAYDSLDEQVIKDIRFAAERIRRFAEIQKDSMREVKEVVSPGVILGHRIIPVQSCATYIPGGRYPLPSSALMSIIPAKVANVPRIVACSPPDSDVGSINPATLVAMDIAGADEIYCMGGAHAIGALAYGTETIKPVDMIVGPGNIWVTEAKRQVFGTVGIDFLAGPSEVLIIADETAEPDFIASDLLAQSEHDPNARGILISLSEDLAHRVISSLEKLLADLETEEVARKSWQDNGQVIVVDSVEDAVKLANKIAPEHLELCINNPEDVVDLLLNYGSLFIGNYAAEVFGDYVSGTNHILPTMKAARYTGGVWVGTFLKVVSFQMISKEGAKELIPAASSLAKTEGLYAHKLAADIRLWD